MTAKMRTCLVQPRRIATQAARGKTTQCAYETTKSIKVVRNPTSESPPFSNHLKDAATYWVLLLFSTTKPSQTLHLQVQTDRHANTLDGCSARVLGFSRNRWDQMDSSSGIRRLLQRTGEIQVRFGA